MSAISIAAPKILDLRDLPDDEKAALAFAAFDSLEPTERFVVVTKEDPRPLLNRFQIEKKGLFEWSPLEEGRDEIRIEITRRNASSGALRAVTEALAWDHDRLDALEAGAFAARTAGDYTTAKEKYRTFAHGLVRHIRFEEEIIFPTFEQKGGIPPTVGPTAVMRDEHIEIRALLDSISTQIDQPKNPVEELRRLFHQVLGEHNFKEEKMLYPGVDRFLSENESDEVVRRVQLFRA